MNLEDAPTLVDLPALDDDDDDDDMADEARADNQRSWALSVLAELHD